MSTLLDLSNRLNPQWAMRVYGRYGAWLPRIAAVILMIIVARIAADLVWTLIPLPKSAHWQAPPPPRATPARPVDLGTISRAALFGTYHAPANPSTSALQTAPETQLNLKLLGILSGDKKLARALIGTEGGIEKPYAVGIEVVSGVKLQAIFPDRVVLARNGQLETLRLDKDRGTPMQNEFRGPPIANAGGGIDENLPADQRLGQLRDQVVADPERAGQYLRVFPVNTGAGLHGYRVMPGPNRELFTDTGLRPGDVVTEVNGVELNSPAKAMQLMGDFSQSSDFTLTVERGGQKQTIRTSISPQ